MSSTQPPRDRDPTRHRDALDGVRGIAVIAVIALHLGVPGMSLGFLGVDVFFVLSGFLITSLLIAERDSTGGTSLPLFWARRCLRILPLYLVYVALCTIGWRTGAVAYERHPGAWPEHRYIASLWLYFSNLSLAHTFTVLTSYGVNVTGHLWSLAVEEQFYLLAPFAFVLLARHRWRWLLWTIPIAQLGTTWRATHWPAAAFLLQTRGISLWAGCAAALLLSWRPALVRHVASRRFGALAAALVIAVVGVLAVVSCIFGEPRYLTVFRVVLPALLVPLAALSAHLWHEDGTSIVAPILAFRPLAYVGRISYGLYVWHMLALSLVSRAQLRHAPTALLTFALALTIAAISYRCWERPFLRLKRHVATPVRARSNESLGG